MAGGDASQMPAGLDPDWIHRKFEAIDQWQREMMPSVAQSVKEIVADLTAAQGTLATTVSDLGTAQTDIAAQLVSINALVGSQVYPNVAHVDAGTFSLATGANVEKVRATITVPSGYTQALIFATATIDAHNSTAASDDFYLQTTINGTSLGYSAQASVSSGGNGCISKGIAGLIPSLGSTFYVNALASSGVAGWSASAYNIVNLDVMVLFLR